MALYRAAREPAWSSNTSPDDVPACEEEPKPERHARRTGQALGHTVRRGWAPRRPEREAISARAREVTPRPELMALQEDRLHLVRRRARQVEGFDVRDLEEGREVKGPLAAVIRTMGSPESPMRGSKERYRLPASSRP